MSSAASWTSRSGWSAPDLDPAQVEDRADQPVEALGLLIDRVGGAPDAVGRPADGRIGQVPGGRADARQGRPQVMRHRVEEGALERVAAAGHLGGHRILAQPVASEAERDLVGRQREQPGRLLVRWPAAARLHRPQRAEVRAARLDPDPDDIPIGCRPGRGVTSSRAAMGADPAGRLLARGPDQRGDDAAAGDGTRARVREDALVLAAGEADPDAFQPGVAGQPLDDRAGHRFRRVGRREQAADGELPGRLDRSSIGLRGALAPECGQAPDGERHDQDEDEVEQLDRVGHDERQSGFGEQDVVDQERDDRRAEGGGRAGHRSDDDDDDEIDRRGVGDPGPLLEDRDHDRPDGDRPDGQCHDRR